MSLSKRSRFDYEEDNVEAIICGEGEPALKRIKVSDFNSFQIIGVNINDLPPEIISMIFEKLPSVYMSVCSQVCHLWHDLASGLINLKNRDKAADLITFAVHREIKLLRWAIIDRGADLKIGLCKVIAECGDLSLLIDIANQGKINTIALWDEIYLGACNAGNTAILEWAYHHSPLEVNFVGREKIMMMSNFPHVLDLGISSGFKMKEEYIKEAARQGKLELLKWAKSKGHRFHPCLYAQAATGGQLEVIDWLVDQSVNTSNILTKATLTCALTGSKKENKLALVRRLRELGFPWCPRNIFHVVQNKDIELYKWAIENGCPRDYEEEACDAARYNALELLKWGVEYGGLKNFITEKVSSAAVCCGSLKVLDWLFDNGYPITSNLMMEAALHMQLAVLDWGLAKRLEINEEMIYTLLHDGNDSEFQWAKNHSNPKVREMAQEYIKEYLWDDED
jgi:F-box domain.